MLRAVSAGLMCMGLVTLGVTALRGQEAAKSDLIADGKPVAEGAGVPAGEDLIEIEIGNDDGLVTGDDVIVRSADGRVQKINRADGRIVEEIYRAAPRFALAQVRASGGPAIDPATREAVEKIVAGLKDEANRLTAAGKKDEAEQKMQSIRAIEQLLNAPRRAGLVVWRPGIPDGPAAEEMKRLHERIGSLRAQAERQPQDGEAHEKMQKEMAELHRKLAELHRGQIFAHPGGLMPGMPGQPGMPVPFGGFPAGGVAAAAPGQHFALQHGGIPAEVQALNQKSAALMQAAAQLQQAGLEEQARDLRKQAEKLQAAAEKIRAEAQPAPGAGGPGGFGVFGGGPPMELQKTIRELQEQIQQLRKEIGELRELLQQPGSGEERRREPRPRER